MPQDDDLKKPEFVDFVDGSPTLFVGDTTLNTNGNKNCINRIDHVAIKACGTIKLCGKSSTNNPECMSSAYIYLEDANGDLHVKFADGSTKVLASPLNHQAILRMRKDGQKVYGKLYATKSSFDPRLPSNQWVLLSMTTPGNGSSKADQKFLVSPNSNTMFWALKFFDDSAQAEYCASFAVSVLLSTSPLETDVINSLDWGACV